MRNEGGSQLISLEGVDVFYGDIQRLCQVSLKILEGEIVALVGANTAGKTTTLNTISGLIKPRSGQIKFLDQRIDLLPPYQIVELGIVQIPEGRRLFPHMTVMENLLLGCYNHRARQNYAEYLEEVFHILPPLKERENQMAGSLSGGEQQMLAIGRGLMAGPKLLMLDEPSFGLAPKLVQTIFRTIKQIKERGTTIFLIEQNVQRSLKMANRGYVLENGRIVLEGKGQELLQSEYLKKAYLGI